MSARYRPGRTPWGAVIQSGLDARPAGQSRRMTPKAQFYRAVIVNTYTTDDPASRTQTQVECDIILVKTQIGISRVPVLQAEHGVNNTAVLWIPRASTRVIQADGSSGEVNLRPFGPDGQSVAEPSDLGLLDGDHVLVSFIENDFDFPVIVRAYTHQLTKRKVVGVAGSALADGWTPANAATTRGKPSRNELYFAHYGFEFRVNAKGELLIDTVGAFTDIATEDATPNVGQMRFRVKGGNSSPKFVVEINGTDVFEVYKDSTGQVRIDLGDGAGERLVLGDSFKTFLNNFFATFFDAHTHIGVTTGVGTSGPPSPTFIAPARQNMGDDVLSDLAKTKKS